jgi:hypothetical protein
MESLEGKWMQIFGKVDTKFDKNVQTKLGRKAIGSNAGLWTFSGNIMNTLNCANFMGFGAWRAKGNASQWQGERDKIKGT